MRILSLDQSFTATAYSIWEGDSLYDFGVISSNKDEAIHTRITYIISELRKTIQEENIDRVVLEGLSLGMNVGNSSRSLAALYYCILMLCEELEIPFEDIPPTTVKKHWTGSGRASKKNMEEHCPPDLLEKIMVSPFKTISRGRRDIIDSFAIYKAFKTLYLHN